MLVYMFGVASVFGERFMWLAEKAELLRCLPCFCLLKGFWHRTCIFLQQVSSYFTFLCEKCQNYDMLLLRYLRKKRAETFHIINHFRFCFLVERRIMWNIFFALITFELCCALNCTEGFKLTLSLCRTPIATMARTCVWHSQCTLKGV